MKCYFLVNKMNNDEFITALRKQFDDLAQMFIAGLIVAPFGVALIVGIYLLLPPDLRDSFRTLLEYT